MRWSWQCAMPLRMYLNLLYHNLNLDLSDLYLKLNMWTAFIGWTHLVSWYDWSNFSRGLAKKYVEMLLFSGYIERILGHLYEQQTKKKKLLVISGVCWRKIEVLTTWSGKNLKGTLETNSLIKKWIMIWREGLRHYNRGIWLLENIILGSCN